MRRAIASVLVVVFTAFVTPMPVVFALQPGPCGPGLPTGCVNGVAADASKQPLANHTVRLRNVANGQTTTVTSGANGSFSFTGVNPGNFVIEIVNASNQVIATSSTVSVAAGATASITVTATMLTGLAAASGATGLAGLFTGTSLVVVTAVGVAGIVIAVQTTQNDEEASPSR
jgi:hypothetical protein